MRSIGELWNDGNSEGARVSVDIYTHDESFTLPTCAPIIAKHEESAARR